MPSQKLRSEHSLGEPVKTDAEPTPDGGIDPLPEPDPEFATSKPDPYPDPEAAADPLPEFDPLPNIAVSASIHCPYDPPSLSSHSCSVHRIPELSAPEPEPEPEPELEPPMLADLTLHIHSEDGQYELAQVASSLQYPIS